jgi:hypothetical protein
VREETAADADVAPSSAVRSPAPTASAVTANTNEDLKGMQDDNNDGLTLDREIGDNSTIETKLAHLRLPRHGWRVREACFKEKNNGSALLLHNFSCAQEWRW